MALPPLHPSSSNSCKASTAPRGAAQQVGQSQGTPDSRTLASRVGQERGQGLSPPQSAREAHARAPRDGHQSQLQDNPLYPAGLPTSPSPPATASGGARTVPPPGPAPSAPPGPGDTPTAGTGSPRASRPSSWPSRLPAGQRPSAPRAGFPSPGASPSRSRREGACAAPSPCSARRAYRSSHAVSLLSAGWSGPSPAAAGGGGKRGASAEAGGAAMELGGLAAGRRPRGGALGPAALASGSRSSRLCASNSLARPVNYKSHKAVRLWMPGLVVRPHPPLAGGRVFRDERFPPKSFTTNSAAQSPWKKINKHLFDTVIFNTYS